MQDTNWHVWKTHFLHAVGANVNSFDTLESYWLLYPENLIFLYPVIHIHPPKSTAKRNSYLYTSGYMQKNAYSGTIHSNRKLETTHICSSVGEWIK